MRHLTSLVTPLLALALLACGSQAAPDVASAPARMDHRRHHDGGASMPGVTLDPPTQCAGTANGGDIGYKGPPDDWSVSSAGGQACAAVNSEPGACVPCTLDPGTDSPQCPVTAGDPSDGGSLYAYTFALDPATSIVYVTADPDKSWTPTCQ